MSKTASKPRVHQYRGCKIVRESGTPTYFGLKPGREGYQTSWFKITFPNGTWVKCGTLKASKAYIDSDRGRTQGGVV